MLIEFVVGAFHLLGRIILLMLDPECRQLYNLKLLFISAWDIIIGKYLSPSLD